MDNPTFTEISFDVFFFKSGSRVVISRTETTGKISNRGREYKSATTNSREFEVGDIRDAQKLLSDLRTAVINFYADELKTAGS